MNSTLKQNYMTFREWQKAYPDIRSEMVEICGTCHGSGEHECSCGDEHPCKNCEGWGKLFPGGLRLREYYDKQLSHDKSVTERWLAIGGGVQ